MCKSLGWLLQQLRRQRACLQASGICSPSCLRLQSSQCAVGSKAAAGRWPAFPRCVSHWLWVTLFPKPRNNCLTQPTRAQRMSQRGRAHGTGWRTASKAHPPQRLQVRSHANHEQRGLLEAFLPHVCQGGALPHQSRHGLGDVQNVPAQCAGPARISTRSPCSCSGS